MTAVVGYALAALYVTSGLVFARGRLRYWHQQDRYDSYSDGAERGMAMIAALAFGLIWPLSLAFLAFRRWMWLPVDRQEERLARLRAERAAWASKRSNGTEAERAMAPDILATLDELLKER